MPKHGSVGRKSLKKKKKKKKFSLFGLIFFSFECLNICLSLKNQQQKKADRRFQGFWVGRKGRYNMFFFRPDFESPLVKDDGILINTNFLSLFLITKQIKNESFLEDINNILNSGDVPNLYGFDELDSIYNAMKPVVLDSGMQATKANLFSAYTKRVKSNIHTVLCMR